MIISHLFKNFRFCITKIGCHGLLHTSLFLVFPSLIIGKKCEIQLMSEMGANSWKYGYFPFLEHMEIRPDHEDHVIQPPAHFPFKTSTMPTAFMSAAWPDTKSSAKVKVQQAKGKKPTSSTVLPLIHKAVVLSKEPRLTVLQLPVSRGMTNAPAQGKRLSQPCQCQGSMPAPAWAFKSFLLQGAYSLFLSKINLS